MVARIDLFYYDYKNNPLHTTTSMNDESEPVTIGGNTEVT